MDLASESMAKSHLGGDEYFLGAATAALSLRTYSSISAGCSRTHASGATASTWLAIAQTLTSARSCFQRAFPEVQAWIIQCQEVLTSWQV